MRKIGIGVLVTAGVLLAIGSAFATLAWFKVFNECYAPKPNGAIKKARCAVCHLDTAGKKGLNPYGQLLKGKKVEAASLKAIEQKDADKDKFSNIAEIKAGTLPGDPKSKPTK
ncbi:MAG: hypothetical protein ACP5R5_00130 [Armatimonadota bacterium]